MLNGIHYARKAINGGNNLYCTTFVNPCTGNRTTLTGKRLLDIVNKNKKVVYKNSEEFLIGLIVRNHNFFRSVWTSYPLALNARDNGRLYCKQFTIPKKLFRNVKKCNILLKGHKINTIITSPNHWIDIDFPKDLQRAERQILPNLISNDPEMKNIPT